MVSEDCSLGKLEPRPDSPLYEVVVCRRPHYSSISLPAGAQSLIGDGSVTCGTEYTIAKGDTLSRLA
jgi:hypothetical protein